MDQGDISGFFGGQGFDSDSVKPAEDFAVLDAGKYPVQILSADMTQTKKQNGHYLAVKFVVLDGPAKGRNLWDNMNLDNPNETAVDIARRSLSALCKATIGGDRFVNTNQLLQKTCVASVKIAKDGSNSIRTYSTFADAQSVQPAQRQTPPPAQNTQPIPPTTPVGMQPGQPVQYQQAPAMVQTVTEAAAGIPPHPHHHPPQAPPQQQVAQQQVQQVPQSVQSPTQAPPVQQPSNLVGKEPWVR
jgi:hypothetical protein